MAIFMESKGHPHLSPGVSSSSPAPSRTHLCVFSWALQAAGSEKALLHSRQEKGFSPVWMRMCRLKLPVWVNSLPQSCGRRELVSSPCPRSSPGPFLQLKSCDAASDLLHRQPRGALPPAGLWPRLRWPCCHQNLLGHHPDMPLFSPHRFPAPHLALVGDRPVGFRLSPVPVSPRAQEPGLPGVLLARICAP